MADAFTASPVLGESLQKVLADVTALSLNAKQLHWNIVGPGFRALHLYLDDVVAIAREASDEVAERMRAIGLTADGRPDSVASANTLPKLGEGKISDVDGAAAAVAAITATVGTLRQVHEKVDVEDPASADILLDYVRRLEQQAWFIGSAIATA
ncbi:starvation-inducible DNA-binding protein [Arcanobacterium wilhelmae]|uniref:Starvation-inducible DNA-binding protein n=1 Tax=Arcanobacterium wilhelmae TaxID=1803177 RepID=A0ABT9N9N0_9ACTO|nr:DNA starvation/stationary phase protection protein [Arcanobacterium wilhelmae]MDP9800420.1 starvation-inducible DNA-binding protein [Arcanobacterium wilhelmae]WFN89846.1 DNA starvation/stationary phase protection protein [Arcanobacterium wilhelmae]